MQSVIGEQKQQKSRRNRDQAVNPLDDWEVPGVDKPGYTGNKCRQTKGGDDNGTFFHVDSAGLLLEFQHTRESKTRKENLLKPERY